RVLLSDQPRSVLRDFVARSKARARSGRGVETDRAGFIETRSRRRSRGRTGRRRASRLRNGGGKPRQCVAKESGEAVRTAGRSIAQKTLQEIPRPRQFRRIETRFRKLIIRDAIGRLSILGVSCGNLSHRIYGESRSGSRVR